MISRPLPAPLPSCTLPGPQLPSQSVFRLAGTAATGSLGPLAGGDSDLQPGRLAREFGQGPRTEVELPLRTGSVLGARLYTAAQSRCVPYPGTSLQEGSLRQVSQFIICIAPPRESFPASPPKE